MWRRRRLRLPRSRKVAWSRDLAGRGFLKWLAANLMLVDLISPIFLWNLTVNLI